MHETTKEYTKRITGYVAGRNHLAVLGNTPKRLRRLLAGVSRTRFAKRSDQDRWSVAEVLTHLAEGEIVFAYRLRLVLGANGTPIQAFDQNRWQENAGYLSRDPKQALALFSALRTANVALVRSLPKRRWSEHGVHEERGPESVTRMIELYAGHDVNHVSQIERSLARSRGSR